MAGGKKSRDGDAVGRRGFASGGAEVQWAEFVCEVAEADVILYFQNGFAQRLAKLHQKKKPPKGLFLLVDSSFLNWNTLESEVLRWKMVFTSRTIPEFAQNGLVW
jgi:hypothetical protein